MIAAGHDPDRIFDYTVGQFRLYLEAAQRRENRQVFMAVVAGQMAWADKAATEKLRAELLDD